MTASRDDGSGASVVPAATIRTNDPAGMEGATRQLRVLERALEQAKEEHGIALIEMEVRLSDALAMLEEKEEIIAELQETRLLPCTSHAVPSAFDEAQEQGAALVRLNDELEAASAKLEDALCCIAELQEQASTAQKEARHQAAQAAQARAELAQFREEVHTLREANTAGSTNVIARLRSDITDCEEKLEGEFILHRELRERHEAMCRDYVALKKELAQVVDEKQKLQNLVSKEMANARAKVGQARDRTGSAESCRVREEQGEALLLLENQLQVALEVYILALQVTRT